jgi:putative transposase
MDAGRRVRVPMLGVKAAEGPREQGCCRHTSSRLTGHPGRESGLRSHCGAQRKVFNWGLAQIKATVAQREAERSYGITAEELALSLTWSAYLLRGLWNRAKGDVAPWWAANSTEAYSSGLANLATALGNWNGSISGKRRGPKVRSTRLKGKRKAMYRQLRCG